MRLAPARFSLWLVTVFLFLPVTADAQCPTESEIANFDLVSQVSGVSANFSWDPVSTPGAIYEIMQTTADSVCFNSFDNAVPIMQTSGTTATVQFNTPNKAYGIFVRVASCPQIDTNLAYLFAVFNTPPQPPTLSARMSSANAITLTVASNETRGFGILIERSVNGGNFSFIQFLDHSCDGAPKEFVDQNLATGTYRYRAVNFNSTAAAFSPEVSLTIGNPSVPDVTAVRLPAGMLQIAGTGGATDQFVLLNRGNASTQISLAQSGSFFSQSPSSFTLAPNQSQTVTITANAQSAGLFEGASIPSGPGVPEALQIPVRLLSTSPPSGTVMAQSNATRVDVAGAPGTSPGGTVGFTNAGNSTLSGLLVADAPWIIPDGNIVTIPPGGVLTRGFTIDRDKRPDAGNPAGTVSGSISLVYPRGSGSNGKATQDTAPGLAAPVGISDTVKPPLTPSGIPALIEGEVALFASGMGNITGSVGVFISDASIVNNAAGLIIGDLKMYFTQAGAASSSVATQPVSAGQSLALADVVNTVFERTEQLGTLQLRSTNIPSLNVNASVFIKSNLAGTFGTAIPVFRSDRGIPVNQELVLTGLRKTPSSHTNLYLQEVAGVASTARVTFYSAGGSALATLDNQSVGPFGLLILGQQFVPEGATTAVVRTLSGGRLVSYATPVDRASGDTWAVTDWSRYYAYPATSAVIVPVAGAAPGRNNTYFTTDVSIANNGTSTVSGTLRYYQQIPNVATFDQRITLPSRQTAVMEDVVTTRFGLSPPSLGHLVFTPDPGAQFTVTSRTYTTIPGDVQTFGTAVPALTMASAIGAGQSKVIGGLKDSTAATTAAGTAASFRTNIGLVEVTGSPVTVRVSVLFADGKQLAAGTVGAKDYQLVGREFRQLNAIVSEILGAQRETQFGNLDNVQVKVEVVGGTGRILAYATLTDNGSGDTVLRME